MSVSRLAEIKKQLAIWQDQSILGQPTSLEYQQNFLQVYRRSVESLEAIRSNPDIRPEDVVGAEIWLAIAHRLANCLDKASALFPLIKNHLESLEEEEVAEESDEIKLLQLEFSLLVAEFLLIDDERVISFYHQASRDDRDRNDLARSFILVAGELATELGQMESFDRAAELLGILPWARHI